MDKISTERRSANMRAIKYRDMVPEMRVRRIIHGMGYRFRLHRKDLPGTPDLVFPSQRKIIFVHGCFWHQHEHQSGHKIAVPKSRRDYWIPKLEGNVRRDYENEARLKAQGWRVLVVWECEAKGDETILRTKLRDFLGKQNA